MSNEFQLDMSDGFHKYDHPNGKTWQKYQIINGQPHGKWSHFFVSGQVSEEKFYSDGKKVGCWKTYHENGKQWSEDTYKDDKKEGISSFLINFLIPIFLIASLIADFSCQNT